MTGIAPLSTDQIDADSPIIEDTLIKLRDNPLAMFEGAPGAPKLQDLALVQATAGTSFPVYKDANFYELDFGNTLSGENSKYNNISTLLAHRGGEYTVTIDVKGYSTEEVGFRIYKNGVAFGALHTALPPTGVITEYTWTEALQFSAGDLVELRGVHGGVTGYESYNGHITVSSGVFVPGFKKISLL